MFDLEVTLGMDTLDPLSDHLLLRAWRDSVVLLNSPLVWHWVGLYGSAESPFPTKWPSLWRGFSEGGAGMGGGHQGFSQLVQHHVSVAGAVFLSTLRDLLCFSALVLVLIRAETQVLTSCSRRSLPAAKVRGLRGDESTFRFHPGPWGPARGRLSLPTPLTAILPLIAGLVGSGLQYQTQKGSPT